MESPLPTTSYAILGLLSFAPMSGYDLSSYADKTIGHFWPISRSQIYAELARLEGLGLATGRDVEQEGVPDKRVFSLTPGGAEALDKWLDIPGYERQRVRSGLLVKMFFAHRMSRETVLELLADHRREAESTREHLQTVVDLLADEPHAFFARSTALLGLRSAEASIDWVDEVRKEMPSEETFDFGPDDAAERAHEVFRAAPKRKG